MDRTERFYKIELMIRHQDSVSFQHLLEHLEVSPATLKRDLQYLRDRMDAPIVYDRDTNGYRFSQAFKGRRHELPGLWFNEGELHALMSMHQILSGLDENRVLTRHLQPLIEKLTGMLGQDESESREMMRRVKLISTAKRKVSGQSFETVGRALMQRKRLRFTYQKRSDGSQSVRLVSPQRLVHSRNTWYLDGWCHEAEQLRRFSVDTIVSAEVLPDRAKRIAVAELEKELDQGYGVFAGKKPKWAELVFSSRASSWVSAEEWHPQQEAHWLPDGRYRLRVPYVEDTELLMDLGRHAGQVEIRSPAVLRQAYVRMLQEGAALQS